MHAISTPQIVHPTSLKSYTAFYKVQGDSCFVSKGKFIPCLIPDWHDTPQQMTGYSLALFLNNLVHLLPAIISDMQQVYPFR